ncbi:MAG: aminopeptidase, partial [Candidatus Woesebacteria bacterium]|nr:aminopeptidase [Candidatus Woesebacteria bacterium]
YPAIRNGNEVDGIFIEFKNGKAVKIKAEKNEKFLKIMLSVDENSSYLGELGIGLNPKVKKFTKDLLFDEKIGGTIHLAFGMAYKQNGGGNDSAIHWDIVKDMHKGEIILDGKTVQKNGKWVI